MNSELNAVLQTATKRWLNSIQLNEGLASYGCCDREYWAWKTKDFANGTLQAGISGFLDSHHLLKLKDSDVRRICQAVLKGTDWIQRSNGSFEEAYPYESSYAVTGLVLFELMYSALRYPQFFQHPLLKKIVDRAEGFLSRTPETHGVISNHVATTVMALEMVRHWRVPESFKWSSQLEQFLNTQNAEGWFTEYNGADPGYQTLLNSYLIRGYQAVGVRNQKLEECLDRSLGFCERFCFPTGAFAGEIGSRGTAIVYPSGLLFEQSDGLSVWFFQKYLANIGGVQPLTIDVGNFVPLYNSWSSLSSIRPLPKTRTLQAGSILMPAAGFDIEVTPTSVSVISAATSAQRLFVKQGEHWEDLSTVGFSKDGYSSHLGFAERDGQKISLTMGKTVDMYNSWFKSTIIRVIGRLIYPFPPLQRAFKSALAKAVMSGRKASGPQVKLELNPGQSAKLLSGDAKSKQFGFDRHMASANYFPQRPDLGT